MAEDNQNRYNKIYQSGEKKKQMFWESYGHAGSMKMVQDMILTNKKHCMNCDVRKINKQEINLLLH